MTSPAITPRSPRSDTRVSRPYVPHTSFMRELTMVDGRKVLVDKRAIAFICQAKPEDFEGKKTTIVAFKTWAKAVPVVEGYHDLKAWWRAESS